MSAYSDRILSLVPALYLRLGDPSGVIAADSSGHGWNGAYVGSPTLAQTGALTGDTDTAVRFDGVSAHVDISASLVTTAGQSVTLEVWQLVATADVKAASGYTLGDLNTPNRCLAHAPYSDKIFYWDYGNATAGQGRVSTDYTPYLNSWTLVHLTFDSGTSKHAISFNGVEVASSINSNSPTVGFTGGHLAISVGTPGVYWKGVQDEFAVYTYALSPSDRLANYNMGINPTVSGPTVLPGTDGAAILATL